ncbi:MAG: sn-glycerol-3-phosphate ABC transporter ATP-binding protein UgpC [Mesorhizobium sp.]|uniref:ABC transporter ATP-binding protein n=1 Tax=Mesorhizobium sp. TaxID=1871066 RepID=UPI001AC726B4|nr:sn-glycerol-3-phosphate ABC transporter ATP-binding protein UgpC [Mesorhizobium sp.]MBN9223027.1 sn-glycerol-3-phosphate ABC transporter ATP-binding protein UgpC [Mesorhizobium sp.]
MAEVVFNNVSKSYGAVSVVRGLNLSIKHNEFVALVGPSGCGKSTTLRMIAGLEEISSGAVSIGDRVVNDLKPRDRNIAMVFQNYALYPHMTVRENMSFGLRLTKMPEAEIAARVGEAARILNLSDKLDRTPAKLSGGERQRVAMGRAMVRRPDVFLFDEPLSNLDAKLRTTMRTEIKRLHRQVQTTIVYVTHDQVEAMTLADRIVIMRDGLIEQVGTPDDVFSRPANVFVAGFIGSPPMNFIDAVAVDSGVSVPGGEVLPLDQGRFKPIASGTKLTLGVRADDIVPVGHGQAPLRSLDFSAPIQFSEPLGNESLLIMEFGGREVVAKMLAPVPVAPGQVMPFQLNLQKFHLFDAATGISLAASRP